MHVAVVYFVAAGLGIVPAPFTPDPIEAKFIPEESPPVEPVDAPEPTIEPPIRVQFEPPVVEIDAPGDSGGIDVDFRTEPRVVQEIVTPPAPQVVGVRGDPRYPLTQPPYPPSMVRAGNEGSVDIEIYVLPSGRVGDARVVRSTGFPALDQSAIDEAKRRWRLQPATRDGVPYAEWHRLRVVFELRNR
jgi:protein TonB